MFVRLLLGLAAILVLSTASVAADMTVFGIELGKSIALVECPKEIIGGRVYDQWPAEKACVTSKPERQFGYDAEVRRIRFADNEVPLFVKSREMTLLEINEALEGLEFFTFGTRDQGDVFAALNKKYGKPVAYKKTKVQNRMGAAFDSISAEWKRGGVWVSLEGTYGEIDKGRVTIDTDAGHAARTEWIKKRFGHKREL